MILLTKTFLKPTSYLALVAALGLGLLVVTLPTTSLAAEGCGDTNDAGETAYVPCDEEDDSPAPVYDDNGDEVEQPEPQPEPQPVPEYDDNGPQET